jgi:hypothetical protein
MILSASKLKASFHFTDRIKLLWVPSTDTDVTGYKIYRNDVLLASTDENTTEYDDRTVTDIFTEYNYKLTTVTSSGESDPIEATGFLKYDETIGFWKKAIVENENLTYNTSTDTLEGDIEFRTVIFS